MRKGTQDVEHHNKLIFNELGITGHPGVGDCGERSAGILRLYCRNDFVPALCRVIITKGDDQPQVTATSRGVLKEDDGHL